MSLASALRSPRKTANEAITQLRRDWKEDPVRTAAEFLTPIPSPFPKALRKRDILIPQDLALPAELEALRAAARETGEVQRIRPPKPKWDERTKLAMRDNEDFLRWQEEMAKNYGGWYLDDSGLLRKEIGPVSVKESFANAPEGTKFQLETVIEHPDLLSRLYQTKRELPTAIRQSHDPIAGGSYWDGNLMGSSFGRPELKAGGEGLGSDFTDTVNHEVQHMVQDFGNMAEPYRGSSMYREGLEGYFKNPGEIEARIAGLRSRMTPGQRSRNSTPRMIQREVEFLRQTAPSELRPMSLYEHLKHELGDIDVSKIQF